VDLVESLAEGAELRLDLVAEGEVGYEVEIFSVILRRHFDFISAGL
jgi:hypothetical protein